MMYILKGFTNIFKFVSKNEQAKHLCVMCVNWGNTSGLKVELRRNTTGFNTTV